MLIVSNLTTVVQCLQLSSACWGSLPLSEECSLLAVVVVVVVVLLLLSFRALTLSGDRNGIRLLEILYQPSSKVFGPCGRIWPNLE